MKKISISQEELDGFLEAIFREYGYDFRDYASSSLHRRLLNVLEKYEFLTLGACLAQVLQDPDFFITILCDMTITVTELFRDPFVYLAIRKHVIPYLKTYPSFKIWHAGCATGEEVYSLAILLKEMKIYNRARIYATDINLKALEEAKSGLLSNEAIRKGTLNYFEAGGHFSLNQYIVSNNHHTLLVDALRERVVFSDHNLVIDSSFGEMQFILCRNVMIYFGKSLQERVLQLLTESLCIGGYLCLGSKETINFSSVENQYECIDSQARLYRKIKGGVSL